MDEMGLRPDTHLEIHQEQGKIALTPLQETRVSLDELLGQITSENLHGEMDWGASTGRDAW
jgi:antitoxin MazE